MNELITSLNLNAVGTLCMFINIDGNNGHNTYICHSYCIQEQI